jgi:hypothetical protein
VHNINDAGKTWQSMMDDLAESLEHDVERSEAAIGFAALDWLLRCD